MVMTGTVMAHMWQALSEPWTITLAWSGWLRACACGLCKCLAPLSQRPQTSWRDWTISLNTRMRLRWSMPASLLTELATRSSTKLFQISLAWELSSLQVLETTVRIFLDQVAPKALQTTPYRLRFRRLRRSARWNLIPCG